MNQAFNQHATSPRHMGSLPAPDGHALFHGPCGDAMEFFLYVQDGRIAHATYIPHGCLATRACGSALADMIQELTLEEALDMDPEQIARALGGLPPDHAHCAELAVSGLRAAVSDHYQRSRQGWKGLYGRS